MVLGGIILSNEIRVRSQIQKIVENLSSTWYVKNEINVLPKLIRDNEDVIYLTSGSLSEKKANSAIIVLTNKRIIFYDEMPFSASQEFDISLTEINNVTWSMHLGDAQIVINHDHKTEKVSNVNKDEADTFCRLALKQIKSSNNVSKIIPVKKNNNQSGTKTKNEFIKIENRYIRKSSIIEVEKINDYSLIVTTSKVINGTSFQVLKQFNSDDDIQEFLSQLGLEY